MIAERPLTDGTIALLNLSAQIDALEPEVRLGRATIETRAGLIELITLRGLIVGRIADYVRAEEIAEQLVCDSPTHARAFVARARTRAGFHRFDDALADVTRAERLSLDAETANGERAVIFQAIGRYDEALALREEAAARRASFENVAALVGLHAERSEVEAAERRYAQTLSLYRGVSPFPLALLDFQLGLMWMNEGRLDDARRSFEAARRRVPAYAPAQGHLAELEAQLGEIDSAVARLSSLAISSDDPDYVAQLARILRVAGRKGESEDWRRLAAARFDELIASRPEAFADHAAEFWLAAGADPDKALELAKMNVEVRNTPRARALLAQAVAASDRGRRVAAPAQTNRVHDRGAPGVRSASITQPDSGVLDQPDQEAQARHEAADRRVGSTSLGCLERLAKICAQQIAGVNQKN
jgi:tetratricopeptide (TPR) repeat protein